MKSLLFFLSLLFAVVYAQSTSEDLKALNHVIDGGFEDVPGTYRFASGFKAGNWAFSDRASVTFNRGGAYCKNGTNLGCTPYGRKYAIFYKQGQEVSGSVSQHLKGMNKGPFQLSYAYRIVYVPGTGCSLTTSMGPHVVDTLEIPAGAAQFQDWMTRSVQFTSPDTNGTLMIQYRCEKSAKPKFYEFYLDNIVINGTASGVEN